MSPHFVARERASHADVGRGTLPTYLVYIAANIRRLRHERQMTQRALAEASCITLRHLTGIELANTSVSLGTIVAISEALGTTPCDLLQPATMPAVKRGRPRRKPVD